MLFDLFKKQAITSSSELEAALRFGGQSLAGVSVTAATALRFAPVFTAIRVLAESISQLPLSLYETSGNRRDKATGHRLYRLLHLAPNSYQTSQEWREMLVAHCCLKGNFYCYINRVRSEVRELLPLQPDAVEPKLGEDYELRYKVTYADGSTNVYDAQDIFHVKLFSTDGIKGLSIVGQARETIGLGMATEKYGSLLFSNGARPGGILSTEQKLTKEQTDLIRESWEATHGGSENAHKAAILQGGLSWTSVGMNAEDAQTLQTRKYQRTEVAAMFNVPPYMLGDLDNANYSNMEQQSADFVTRSLMPWITRIEQRINLSLLTVAEQGRYSAKFNVAGLLRGDMAARAAFYTSQIQNGALSPNEIRALEDMNPREGGDIYLTPLNMAINGQAPKDDKQ